MNKIREQKDFKFINVQKSKKSEIYLYDSESSNRYTQGDILNDGIICFMLATNIVCD